MYADRRALHSFPTLRSSDLRRRHPAHFDGPARRHAGSNGRGQLNVKDVFSDGLASWLLHRAARDHEWHSRSEEHTSELQSQSNLVCRRLLEKKKQKLHEMRL